MQVTTDHLTPDAAQTLLNALPEKIQLGLLTYAAQLEQPVESVIEMAISSFLDEDSISFSGCDPLAVSSTLK